MELSSLYVSKAQEPLTQENFLTRADVSLETIQDAHDFHNRFLETSGVSDSRGVYRAPKTDWAAKILRRTSVPEAVVEKIGSNSLCKRRPLDTEAFLKYVERQFQNEAPINFRIPVGPLKNINRCGSEQRPDVAEYLMLIQLARVATAIAPLYPHGIKVQLVPDDRRACKANLCPDKYMSGYIAGLQNMNKALGFESWLHIESGQAALYKEYNVESYQDAAEQVIADWEVNDPETFNARWQVALDSAEKNFPANLVKDQPDAVAKSARRYLVAHQAEILSGMWSTRDAFPLVMANHKGNFQLFSLGAKKTKLPWQISLPADVLKGTDLEKELSPLFPKVSVSDAQMANCYAWGMISVP